MNNGVHLVSNVNEMQPQPDVPHITNDINVDDNDTQTNYHVYQLSHVSNTSHGNENSTQTNDNVIHNRTNDNSEQLNFIIRESSDDNKSNNENNGVESDNNDDDDDDDETDNYIEEYRVRLDEEYQKKYDKFEEEKKAFEEKERELNNQIILLNHRTLNLQKLIEDYCKQLEDKEHLIFELSNSCDNQNNNNSFNKESNHPNINDQTNNDINTMPQNCGSRHQEIRTPMKSSTDQDLNTHKPSDGPETSDMFSVSELIRQKSSRAGVIHITDTYGVTVYNEDELKSRATVDSSKVTKLVNENDNNRSNLLELKKRKPNKQ